MSAKHTQDGPWVDAGMTGPSPRITGGPLRLVKSKGVVIAFMPAWLDDEHEEAHANVRLVAAAPDLLEFAEEVRRTGDTRLASMAIAVIAKATGEQP